MDEDKFMKKEREIQEKPRPRARTLLLAVKSAKLAAILDVVDHTPETSAHFVIAISACIDIIITVVVIYITYRA